mgnify:FL=1
MEVFKMAQPSKRDYLEAIYWRYQKAAKKQKSMILEEFSRACRYHRKYAIGLLGKPLKDKEQQKKKPTGRLPIYGKQAISILASIWKASGYLCSQRLKPALSHWLPWAGKRFSINENLEKEISSISPRQMDRRLAPYKTKFKRKLYGTTKPGSLLKRMIPIRTDFWDVKKAGYSEIDLVSHSGASGEGAFIYTLDSTDIKTTWVERQAVMGKSKEAVVTAMVEIESNLPFDLLGIDSDNGSEFINGHLYKFCQERKGRKVAFTRSREYKKDDNAHIEQKNWTHVRKLLGWDRYDSPEALEAVNDVYKDLRIFQNLFQPSMKLVKKIHQGSRLIRRYDTPKTPFERVIECAQAQEAKVKRLQEIYRSTDPFELSQRIDKKLGRIYKLAARTKQMPRGPLPKQPVLTPEEIKDNDSERRTASRQSKFEKRRSSFNKSFGKGSRKERRMNNKMLIESLG